MEKAKYITANLDSLGCFEFLQNHDCGLPLLVFRLKDGKYFAFDEFALAEELCRQGGWSIPAYSIAPHCEHIKVIRLVVRQDLSQVLCDELISDVKKALNRLVMMGDSGGPSHMAMTNWNIERNDGKYSASTHEQE